MRIPNTESGDYIAQRTHSRPLPLSAFEVAELGRPYRGRRWIWIVMIAVPWMLIAGCAWSAWRGSR